MARIRRSGGALSFLAGLTLLAWGLCQGGSVGAQSPEEACAQLQAACRDTCGAFRQTIGENNCQPTYSDCFNQVHACVSVACSFTFDCFYAAAPEFNGCAQVAFQTYITCLTGCNAASVASRGDPARLQTLYECGKACEGGWTDEVLTCKAAACDPACKARGSASGAWYPRQLPLWESCQCVATTATPSSQQQAQPVPVASPASSGSSGPEDVTPASCRTPVHAFRIRLDYAFSLGEVLGYTRICYIVQELDGDDVPGRQAKLCFQGGGVTFGSPVNYSVSPRATEWTRVETRGGPMCLEDLGQVNGYHSSAGAFAWGGGGFFIGDRQNPWNRRIQVASTGAQVGFYAGIDWMWGRWNLVGAITE